MDDKLVDSAEALTETTVDETLEETAGVKVAGRLTKKRLAIILGSLGTLIIAALIVGLAVSDTGKITTIKDADVPLTGVSTNAGNNNSNSTSSSSSSSNSNTNNNSGNNNSGGGSGGGNTDGDTGGNPGGGSPGGGGGTTAPPGGGGGGTTSPPGGGGGGTTPPPDSGGGGGPTWHPPWEEQVWVDTSGWQSVHVGDNPVYEQHNICNTCGAIVSGFAAQHMLETGHAGHHTAMVLVGHVPVYEDVWVESGYWTTITHPGYWAVFSWPSFLYRLLSVWKLMI
ncbi:MAG: hypothetical protein FWE41_03360 [Coriobacteriia bacterium]|nr:hypothetical protein [Coriobacteriia bacterium]MCL2749612.1 hypothetical protein [Coriobacteriia bacterium]